MVCCVFSMLLFDYLCSFGGQMCDQVIYFFDFLCFFIGDEVCIVVVMGVVLVLLDIVEFGDVDIFILMMQMCGGVLVQLDNICCIGYGYDEWIILLGVEGVLEFGSQLLVGFILWCGNQCIELGLWLDWFSWVQGFYYQYFDVFICFLNGEIVVDLFGLLDGLQVQVIVEVVVQFLQYGQFVVVDDCC